MTNSEHVDAADRARDELRRTIQQLETHVRWLTAHRDQLREHRDQLQQELAALRTLREAQTGR
jgi:prefoldin subunit 5